MAGASRVAGHREESNESSGSTPRLCHGAMRSATQVMSGQELASRELIRGPPMTAAGHRTVPYPKRSSATGTPEGSTQSRDVRQSEPNQLDHQTLLSTVSCLV